MECDGIRDRLSGYFDGELPADVAGRIDAHLAECPGCAAVAQGLKETLSLLAALPRESAPPELLDGVLRKIEREKAEAGSLRRKLFHPAHVKIPIEAAAAVLIVLLVYGVQKEKPAERTPPPPAAPVGSARPVVLPSPTVAAGPPPIGDPSPGRKQATAVDGRVPRIAERGGAAKPGDARAPRAQDARALPLPGPVAERGVEAEAGAGKTGGKSAPLPAVPATLVSSEGRRIAPAPRRDMPAGSAAPGILGAPPSRLLRPLPYGREVTIVVPAGERPGIEERIADAAARRGGIVVGDPRLLEKSAGTAGGSAPERGIAAMRGEVGAPRAQDATERPTAGDGPAPRESMDGREQAEAGNAGPADRNARTSAPEPVRVHVPAGAAEAFIDDLRTLGSVPPEGTTRRIDLPAGPTPGVVAYTVRIRVR